MTPDPVRLGILGCGRIVRKMIPAIGEFSGVDLRALASSRPGIAEEWCREFGVKRAYQSYDDLLRDPDIDAVYIPASGDQHCPLTLAAAAAGKHVLCEKPLAMSIAEAEAMTDACRRSGVILQEAFMWRHHPRTVATHQLLSDGAIGKLRMIHVSFSFPLKPDDWRMQPQRGGGALWDIGSYGVDAARYFTGRQPCEIYARACYAATGIDLTTQLAMRFPGDVLVHIDCSFEVPWRCRMELVGSTGRIVWPTAFQHWDPVVRLYQSSNWKDPPQEIVCEDVSQYTCQIQAFCDSIQRGQLLPPAEDGLLNMQVLDEAYRQIRATHRTAAQPCGG